MTDADIARMIRHARDLAEITEDGFEADLQAANRALRVQARTLRELADALERMMRARQLECAVKSMMGRERP